MKGQFIIIRNSGLRNQNKNKTETILMITGERKKERRNEKIREA